MAAHVVETGTNGQSSQSTAGELAGQQQQQPGQGLGERPSERDASPAGEYDSSSEDAKLRAEAAAWANEVKTAGNKNRQEREATAAKNKEKTEAASLQASKPQEDSAESQNVPHSKFFEEHQDRVKESQGLTARQQRIAEKLATIAESDPNSLPENIVDKVLANTGIPKDEYEKAQTTAKEVLQSQWEKNEQVRKKDEKKKSDGKKTSGKKTEIGSKKTSGKGIGKKKKYPKLDSRPKFVADSSGNFMLADQYGDVPYSAWPFSPKKITFNENGEYRTVEKDEDSWTWNQRLLPGGIQRRIMRIPEYLLKNNKLSTDQKIEAWMKKQAESHLLDNTYETPDIRLEERDTARGKTVEAVDQQLSWVDFAYVPTEGQSIDENGFITFSPEVQEAIDWYMDKMHYMPEEIWLVMHQVSKRLGYSPDSNNKFLGKDSNKIPAWLFRKALVDAYRSTVTYGHPYHMMDYFEYGNTPCFPIGIMSQEEAEILCRNGGPLEGQDKYQVITAARNDFVTFTQNEIYKYAQTHEDGLKQLIVLLNFARGLCASAGISPRKYNIAEAYDRGYAELIASCDPAMNPDMDPDVAEQMKHNILMADARKNRSQTKLDHRRNRRRYYYLEDEVDPNDPTKILHRKGERVNNVEYLNNALTAPIRSSKLHPIEAFCNFIANWAKTFGVIGFAPIIVSAPVEHFVGNYYAVLSNKALGANVSEDYRVLPAMYAHIETAEGIDAIKALKILEQTGGMDAVIVFYSRYKKAMTTENVRKFLSEDVNQESLFSGEMWQKVKGFANNINNTVIEKLLPGDIGFERADARRWLEGLMINNGMNSENEYSMERSFTSAEVLEMMESMGIQGFVAAMCDTTAGRDAFLMMRNQTMARESPLSHAIDVIMKRSGVTNMLVTLGIDTYFKYGINMLQAYLPFTNTISYLVVKLANQVATGGVWNTSELNLGILDYQMGGNDRFGQGLVKNLMYDFVRFGNVGLFSCLVAIVLQLIGFDEPKEESLKYIAEEYIIGRKIGLGGRDENGNPVGIPLYHAWWLDDITMFGLPLAYAIASCGVKQRNNDPDLPTKLFFDGCARMISGASIFDLIRSVTGAHDTLAMFDELCSDPNAVMKPNFISFTYMQFIELPIARAVNKLTCPNFLREAFKDEYDHTPYKIYNRDSSTPGATEPVKSWVDLQRRIESRYNPAYAIWNNLWQNHYPFDDGTTTKTGYLFNEMPFATLKDQVIANFMDNVLDYHPEDVPADELFDYNTSKCEQLIEIIKSYGGDIKTALANGFMIPYELRVEFTKYCRRRINFAENYYNQQVQEGITGAAKNDAYTWKQNQQDEYYTYLNDWAFNKEIPWSDAGYVKLRTNSEPVYFFKNSGKPATYLEYLADQDKVERRYIPRGDLVNAFSALAPFTSPETQGRGYNYETKSKWYDKERSNLDEIFNRTQLDEQGNEIPALVPYGRDKGVPLNTAVFGGDKTFVPEGELFLSTEFGAREDPTVGYRGYEAFDESLLANLPNYRKEALTAGVLESLKAITNENVDGGDLGEMGIHYDKDHWKTSSTPVWYKSSGGSGWSSSSGSNYFPKIYSNPRSLNSSRPATMYSKRPDDAKINSYLRPAFSTKGSREAYKRQDI